MNRNVRRFFPYLRRVRVQVTIGLVASVLGASMEWIAPWPLKLIFDSVMARRPLPAVLTSLPASPQARLNVLVLAMLGAALLLGLFSYVAAQLLAHAGQRVVFEVRRDFFRHLEAQSLGFHQRRSTGDLLSRLGSDTQALQSMLVDAIPSLMKNSVTLIGMVAIMLFMDWRFTLVALSLWPVLYFTVRYFMYHIKAAQRRARRWEGEANTIAQEALTSLTVVQAFGREEHEADRFTHFTGEGLRANQRAVTLQAAFTPIATVLMTVTTVLVVWLGVRTVLAGSLTPGDLIVFTAYLRGMYSPVRQLAKLANIVSRGQASAERIVEILDTREEIPELPDARTPGGIRGMVDLDRVSFSYADGRDVLTSVTLHVPVGARVALVGATGSGKSTLLRFVPRFFDPTQGTVRLDGVDVREFTVAGLRRQVALVPQEPYVFRGTVWENIAYGGDDVSRDDAIAAARAVGVDQVLSRLSDGYDTFIAERGSTLSGGQRQCIALARAMARDPRVLLLDEPTTGLDGSVEAVVLAALSRLARNRTTIVVSHDMAAVRDVDFVAVIERGRIVRFGTPREVLAAGRAALSVGSLLGTMKPLVLRSRATAEATRTGADG